MIMLSSTARQHTITLQSTAMLPPIQLLFRVQLTFFAPKQFLSSLTNLNNWR